MSESPVAIKFVETVIAEVTEGMDSPRYSSEVDSLMAYFKDRKLSKAFVLGMLPSVFCSFFVDAPDANAVERGLRFYLGGAVSIARSAYNDASRKKVFN